MRQYVHSLTFQAANSLLEAATSFSYGYTVRQRRHTFCDAMLLAGIIGLNLAFLTTRYTRSAPIVYHRGIPNRLDEREVLKLGLAISSAAALPEAALVSALGYGAWYGLSTLKRAYFGTPKRDTPPQPVVDEAAPPPGPASRKRLKRRHLQLQ